MTSVYLPLTPLHERHQLEEGDPVDERDVRRLFVLHRRAAYATPLLLEDGWQVWCAAAGLEAGHPDVETVVEAEARLMEIGVPLGWVQVFGRESAGDVGAGIDSSE